MPMLKRLSAGSRRSRTMHWVMPRGRTVKRGPGVTEKWLLLIALRPMPSQQKVLALVSLVVVPVVVLQRNESGPHGTSVVVAVCLALAVLGCGGGDDGDKPVQRVEEAVRANPYLPAGDVESVKCSQVTPQGWSCRVTLDGGRRTVRCEATTRNENRVIAFSTCPD